MATKGGKQIFEENIETYKFYRNMMVGSFTLHALCMAFLIEFSYGVFVRIQRFLCEGRECSHDNNGSQNTTRR